MSDHILYYSGCFLSFLKSSFGSNEDHGINLPEGWGDYRNMLKAFFKQVL
jgi:hypothetical protein